VEYGTNEGHMKCIQDFCRETWREGTAWDTSA